MLTAPTKLLTCFTTFCWVLTAFVQPVAGFMGLRVMLVPKPLPDFMSLCGMRIVFVERLQTFTCLRAANSSYETFTGLHKLLHGANCTCRTSTSQYEPLREANCTYQISNWFYDHLRGANCT